VVTEPYHLADYYSGVPKKLWHTTDSGATWRRVWVSLSRTARFIQVTRK